MSLTYSFRPHSSPRIDSASNRNEYQGYLLRDKRGRYVRLTTLPPSYADCLAIWVSQAPETLSAWPGIALWQLVWPEDVAVHILYIIRCAQQPTVCRLHFLQMWSTGFHRHPHFEGNNTETEQTVRSTVRIKVGTHCNVTAYCNALS